MDHHELNDNEEFFGNYSDGSVDYTFIKDFVPPSLDEETGVLSKDIAISPETGLSARIYLPATSSCDGRMPIVLYAHGGAGLTESVLCFTFHNYLNGLVAKARAVAVAVEYRLATMEASVGDMWAALRWVVDHAGGQGDPWLLEFGDIERISVMGDTSGATLVHWMTMRAGLEGLPAGSRIDGAVIVHPQFWGPEALPGEEEIYEWFTRVIVAQCELHLPAFEGLDDPRLNPWGRGTAPVEKMACARLLVCSAEKDLARVRARDYYYKVATSGWGGGAEYFETLGEDHLFYLCDLKGDDADALHCRIADFLNGKPPPKLLRRTSGFS